MNKKVANIFVFAIIVLGSLTIGNKAEAKVATFNFNPPKAYGKSCYVFNNDFNVNLGISGTYEARITNADTGSIIDDGSSVPVGTKIKLDFFPADDPSVVEFWKTIRWRASMNNCAGVNCSGNNGVLWQSNLDTNPTSTSGYIMLPHEKTYLVITPFSDFSISLSGTANLNCSTGNNCNAASGFSSGACPEKICAIDSPGSIKVDFNFSSHSGKLHYSTFHGSDHSYCGKMKTASDLSTDYVLDIPAQTITYNLNAAAACVDSSWSPDTSTVCSGANFTQTSNCGNTRNAVGTKNCTTGTINVIAKLDNVDWSGSVNYSLTVPVGAPIVGSFAPITFANRPIGTYTLSYPNDGSGPSGATLLSITLANSLTLSAGSLITFTMNFVTDACVDSSWSPDTSTVCSGANFTQTGNCGATRNAIGTKDCSSACIPDCSNKTSICNGVKFSNGCPGGETACTGERDCSWKEIAP